MKKITKLTSLILTFALILGLTSSLTACKPVEEVVKSSFNIMIPEENNLSVKLMSSEVTTTSEGYLSKTLTATVSPATNYNQSVNWSVAWKNADSTWASGKSVTDYIEVVANSQNSLKATVTCKKAFGEQINVTVSSVLDSSKSATCVCNYERRLLNFDLTKMGISEIREVNGEKRVISKLCYADVSDTDITYNVNYSDYTVLSDSSEFSLYMRLTDDFIAVLDSFYADTQLDTGVGNLISGNDINIKFIQYTGDLVLNAITVIQESIITTYYEQIAVGNTVPSSMVPTSYFKILREFGSEKPVGHILVSRSWYDGVSTNYETYCQYPIYLDESVTNLAVKTVTLARNNIIF